jgi:hypothetical protein
MTVYADTDISGQGQVDFGAGVQINYALVHLTNVGPAARPVMNGDADHFVRIGFIAFGNDSDSIGGVIRTYWLDPFYLNWVDSEWVPVPQLESPPVLFSNYARRVRWSLAPGAAGHLFVFGV